MTTPKAEAGVMVPRELLEPFDQAVGLLEKGVPDNYGIGLGIIAAHLRAIHNAMLASVPAAPPSPSVADGRITCESCGDHSEDSEGFVWCVDVYLCATCYAEWKAESDACEHTWEPYHRAGGDDRVCTKCSRVEIADAALTSPPTPAPGAAGEVAKELRSFVLDAPRGVWLMQSEKDMILQAVALLDASSGAREMVEALRQIAKMKPEPIGDTGFETGPLALLNACQRIARSALRHEDSGKGVDHE